MGMYIVNVYFKFLYYLWTKHELSCIISWILKTTAPLYNLLVCCDEWIIYAMQTKLVIACPLWTNTSYINLFSPISETILFIKKNQEYCILIIQKTTSDDSVIPVRFSGDKICNWCGKLIMKWFKGAVLLGIVMCTG